ncbi:MAG: glycerophosphodiester phosphodiesterase [Halobacteriota archaeon]|uniref:glycerophosphodiester phosphodiesterase n=1 Tax=Natronomonas sp. TaxID=2184060 RepID=UPI003975F389
MRLIAHRGFCSTYPENTLQAVEAAASIADEIEIDVRRCGSGELVVIHDETVDRVTDGNGPVAEHTRADLEALDVLGTGQGVPTLEDALGAVPEYVGVNVELKERGTEADALELIDAHHPQAIVSSFSRQVLADCREIDPTVPRAYLTEESGAAEIEIAIHLDCEYFHPAMDICTDRIVADAHRAGMSVTAWSVDSSDEAETLARTGVDGVIADRPDVLTESMV